MNKTIETHVLDFLFGWHRYLLLEDEENGTCHNTELASRVYALYAEAAETPPYTGPQLQQFLDYSVIPLILTNSKKSP